MDPSPHPSSHRATHQASAQLSAVVAGHRFAELLRACTIVQPHSLLQCGCATSSNTVRAWRWSLCGRNCWNTCCCRQLLANKQTRVAACVGASTDGGAGVAWLRLLLANCITSSLQHHRHCASCSSQPPAANSNCSSSSAPALWLPWLKQHTPAGRK